MIPSIPHIGPERFNPTLGLSDTDAVIEWFNYLKPRYSKEERFNYDVLNKVRIQLIDFMYQYLGVMDCKVDIYYEERHLKVLIYYPFKENSFFTLDMSPDFEEWVSDKCQEALIRIYKNIDLM